MLFSLNLLALGLIVSEVVARPSSTWNERNTSPNLFARVVAPHDQNTCPYNDGTCLTLPPTSTMDLNAMIEEVGEPGFIQKVYSNPELTACAAIGGCIAYMAGSCANVFPLSQSLDAAWASARQAGTYSYLIGSTLFLYPIPNIVENYRLKKMQQAAIPNLSQQDRTNRQREWECLIRQAGIQDRANEDKAAGGKAQPEGMLSAAEKGKAPALQESSAIPEGGIQGSTSAAPKSGLSPDTISAPGGSTTDLATPEVQPAAPQTPASPAKAAAPPKAE